VGRAVHGANCPWGELSVGRTVRGASCRGVSFDGASFDGASGLGTHTSPHSGGQSTVRGPYIPSQCGTVSKVHTPPYNVEDFPV
jgi:hypothetical protein